MAGTYSQIYIQYVFTVKGRKSLLKKPWWQEDYGVFSYAHSEVERVYNYILNQELHHHKKTFQEEYLDFLQKFDVEYDEKYLFD